MDEQSNLRNFVEEITSFGEEGPAPKKEVSPVADLPPIGIVVEIAGSGSRIQMDGAALAQALKDKAKQEAPLTILVEGTITVRVTCHSPAPRRRACAWRRGARWCRRR